MTRLAYLALGIGVLGVSTSSILIKWMPLVPALAIAAYRLGFTVLFLGPVALATRRGELAEVGRRDVALSVLGGVFLAAHFAAWITSLKFTSVASSVVLVTLQPVFVLLGARLLFGERVTRAGLLGVALALGGGALIGWSDWQAGRQELQGDWLALVGALLVAFYLLVGRSVRRRLSVLPYTTLVYGAAAVLVAWSLLAGVPLYPYPWAAWLLFLALAVFPTIFGHTMFNYAIGHLPAGLVSVSILGEPVGAAALAYLLLGERLSPLQAVGGLGVLAGIAVFAGAGTRAAKA